VGAVSRFRAPGRVNLIGDHTDYNEGFVLPLAIDLECVVEARPRPDGAVRLRSPVAGWEPYADGVARVLEARGRAPVGLDGAISSTVPVGAGLSSSAALEVALALALCDVAGFKLPPLELALACQEAEHLATGVPSGVMDQLASLHGLTGHALLVDCRDLSIEPIRLPAELAVIAVHSGVTRTLAGSAYAERRAACKAAAARLGVASLRDATAGQVAGDPRARHVVSENARVLAAARALADGDACPAVAAEKPARVVGLAVANGDVAVQEEQRRELCDAEARQTDSRLHEERVPVEREDCVLRSQAEMKKVVPARVAHPGRDP